MARGHCTEIDPRAMPEGLFPEFRQLTLRGGVMRPRNPDETYTPAPGSIEEWRLGKVETSSVAEVYSADAKKSYFAHAPKTGGTPMIYDRDGGAESVLVLPVPAQRPVLAEGTTAVKFRGNGFGPEADVSGSVPAGGRAVYAKTWTGTACDARSGFSPVFDFANEEYLGIYVDMPTMWQVPAAGDVLTNTTQSDTVVISDVVELDENWSNRKICLLVDNREKTAQKTWAENDAVVWPGFTGAATLYRNETPCPVTPTLWNNATIPPEADGWALYRLEESTGIWREAGKALAGETIPDSHFFPYGDTALTRLFPAWPGPLDNNYLPENLVSSLSEAQALALHKGCLFVAEGSKIRYSEPEKPRTFREWAVLEAGGEVLSIVSREEVAEVYTPTSVKYITGVAPYFELRETGINEGPVSRGSIVQTDIGTFALFDDGLYLVRGGSRRNVTSGANTPFIENLVEPSSAVGGASRGVYYLADTGGSCLAFDWEEDEWFVRDFPSRPAGFLYLDEIRSLVAVFSGTPGYYHKVASGSGEVSWSVRWPERGDGKLRPSPAFVFLDIEGEASFTWLVEGESAMTLPAVSGETPLPPSRGRYFSFSMSGEGNGAETAIRAARWR